MKAKLRSLLERAQQAFYSLTERERKLVMAMGALLGAAAVFLPLVVVTSAVSDIATERGEIVQVLREIAQQRASLEQRARERKAAQRRYDQPAPPLGSFIEKKAAAAGITVREVNEQPEKQVKGYRRKHTRVTLPGVGLRPLVEMMAAIDNSPHPVALERVQIDHHQLGVDEYNAQLGVVAFERAAPKPKDEN